MASGATEIIKRANDVPLKTFYPIRLTLNRVMCHYGRNYLFVEFRRGHYN